MSPKPLLALAAILMLLFLPQHAVAGDDQARKSDTLTLCDFCGRMLYLAL